jgi:hypothetical protein
MPLKHGGRDEQETQGATDEDRTTTWTIYGAPGQWTVYRENGSLMGTYPTMQQIEHLADQHAAALISCVWGRDDQLSLVRRLMT